MRNIIIGRFKSKSLDRITVHLRHWHMIKYNIAQIDNVNYFFTNYLYRDRFTVDCRGVRVSHRATSPGISPRCTNVPIDTDLFPYSTTLVWEDVNMPTLTCSSVLYLYLSFNSISVRKIRNTVVSDGKRARKKPICCCKRGQKPVPRNWVDFIDI